MTLITRRNFLKAAALAAALPTRIPGAPEKRPNIILIMIDDLGWMDIHCQGNSRLDTPNIDKLAVQGMRFTDNYAAAPVCSPTRASIMTGLSPARLHITNHIPDRPSFSPKNPKLLSAETLDYLSPSRTTVAERLKSAGYATAFLGKWHLSGRAGKHGLGELEYEPQYQGFDLNIGGCAYGGPPTYFDPYKIHNIPPRKTGEYLPDRLADEAITFIRQNRSGPFFIALWNYTVHWPMEAPDPLVKKYESRLGPGLKDARYGAMIEAMDAAVGRLMAELNRLNLAEDTMLIFTSDNGGFNGVSDNRPLRESKGHLYEGGIRVPLIVRWPQKISAASTCRTPVISTDLYPTVLAAAGLKPQKPLDGESILPLLTRSGPLRRNAICFHYPNYAWHRSNRLGAAIRQGPYKLIKFFEDDSVELYNLEKDLSETTDISRDNPRLTAELTEKLDTWLEQTNAELPPKNPDYKPNQT